MVQAPSAAGAATNAAGAATDSQTTRSSSPVVGEGGGGGGGSSSSSSSNDPAGAYRRGVAWMHPSCLTSPARLLNSPTPTPPTQPPAAAAASTSNGSTTASAAGASSASSSSLGTGPPRYMRPPRGETDHASAMPDEMLLRALSYLDLDSSMHASLVAPRWAGLFNETIAQAHCERIYLDQAHAKVLNPGRFHGSYKQMLRHRPRVRMTGFYVLKSSYIKRPVRDMWTELKPGTILEVRARGPQWVPGCRSFWPGVLVWCVGGVGLIDSHRAVHLAADWSQIPI